MIYKYYSGNENSIDSLKNQKLWFSKPTKFNDPFDTNMGIIDVYTDFKDSISKKNPEFIKDFQEAVKNFGICCFSEENDNMHLWALYANSFKGFVLCFDESGFDDYFSNLFSAKCVLQSVNYRETPLNLDNGVIEEIQYDDDGSKNEIISKPIASFLYDIKNFDFLLEFLIKQKQSATWSIEKEKRLIIGYLARQNGAGKFECPLGFSVPWQPNSLKKIIIGHRMKPSEIDVIRGIIKSTNINIELLQTDLNFSNWEIICKPVLTK